MKKLSYLFAFPFLILTTLSSGSCNKLPFKPDYQNIGGYVIGKETCNTDETKDYWTDETKDYWLLDFTVYPNSPQIGDTLKLNGTTFTNVLKVKELGARLKHTGMMVSIDYKKISSNKIITTGCTEPNSITYPLKELFIINQFEIR